MVQINTYTPNKMRSKKKWWKYALVILGVIFAYWTVNILITYNTIVVDNSTPAEKKSLWGSIKGIFDFGSNETSAFVDPNPMPEKEDSRLDVLILGMRGEDNEGDKDGNWLTDTMLLVSYDKTTKSVNMFSIPRDLYIDMYVPEFDKNFHIKGKINEVYVRGLANGSGIGLVEKVVSKITGVYVDKAIVFDFKAFDEIIKTLGGVDVYLAKPFSEPKQWGYPFELPAGNNHLEGENALYYIRSRFSSSDFDRARRQQQVIEAIRKKATSLGFLANPAKVTSLLSDLKGNIRTDFQIWEIDDALKILNALGNDSKIKEHILTTANYLKEDHNEKGEYILLPILDNYDEIRTLFKNI